MATDTSRALPMQIGQRIIIVGVTGSGKTTLAKRLATRRGLPHVELDALHWDANWTPAPPEVFRQRASQALSGERWVTDGNYSVIREVVWQRADTLIWLDYPLSLILWRLWWRTLWRTTRRLELWNGNHETWRGAFFSRDSLFFWALKTHKKRRREYPELFTRPEHAHLSITRFRSPRATQQWLASLKPQAEHPSL